jgi:hypothetical protein
LARRKGEKLKNPKAYTQILHLGKQRIFPPWQGIFPAGLGAMRTGLAGTCSSAGNHPDGPLPHSRRQWGQMEVTVGKKA